MLASGDDATMQCPCRAQRCMAPPGTKRSARRAFEMLRPHERRKSGLAWGKKGFFCASTCIFHIGRPSIDGRLDGDRTRSARPFLSLGLATRSGGGGAPVSHPFLRTSGREINRLRTRTRHCEPPTPTQCRPGSSSEIWQTVILTASGLGPLAALPCGRFSRSDLTVLCDVLARHPRCIE